MAHEVFVICTNWPKCEGPGVAEYQFGINPEKHKCGFCSVATDVLNPDGSHMVNSVPMRPATDEEIADYKAAHPELHPVQEEAA